MRQKREPTYDLQQAANRIAREAGYKWATTIVLGQQDRVLSRTRPGHRKFTTGEYVSPAYLYKFGWKNTYYQRAETVVEVARALVVR